MVNASFRWLNNVVGVYLVQVSLLLIGPLFRPKNNHTCHEKLNPSRETVPLRKWTFEEKYK